MVNQHGLIAKFDTPADIMHAAEKVRDAGYKNWDVITPFPIHGMDPAMGIKRSLVGRFTIVGGTIGLTTGMLMIWFTGASELSLPYMEGYKLIVGGKPYFSPQFAFPVSYELTILFSAFASIGGMFILNKLPRHHHPVLKYKDVAASSDDKFFLYIENEDPQFDGEKTRSFLNDLGPVEVGELEE
ncbi:DUF3341 domain-containing protein [Candidatus Pelagisphaera phototrophica]|jgi:hypothetical protein|uniref:DUF3341 domain-containing protein n=1 Tax=Candidatus Pelagisphaera phototrophica TaxID=2684113 RepID=UPI0019F08653|nr:DUF3341 domain-containing protein [Candidatus Pelagisphaera phototrophica]QXD33323.1 DUF3341 domain-containing protein [Candidatus Pelagisphaera phototrophica]|tara:strand:- start:3261 stop:3815 length:555 start_codon:yes stop_codon:yes gene_type:complete